MILEVLLGFAGGVAWSAAVGYRIKRRQAQQSQTPSLFPSAPAGVGSNQAAIVLMSLPPEDSAVLFRELPPEVVQQLTSCIVQLPPVDPDTRQRAIAAFTQYLGSSKEFYQAVADSPRAAAAALLKLMLSDEPVANAFTR